MHPPALGMGTALSPPVWNVVVTPVPPHHRPMGSEFRATSETSRVGLSPAASREGCQPCTGHENPFHVPDRLQHAGPRPSPGRGEECDPGAAGHELASLWEEMQAATGTSRHSQASCHSHTHPSKPLPSSPSPPIPLHPPPPLPPTGPCASRSPPRRQRVLSPLHLPFPVLF